MPLNPKEPVKIVDYDPAWVEHFQQLSQALSAHLGDMILSIEHVGSTSVPGLAAKPIIDLDIVIATPEPLADVIHVLTGLGYQHEGDLGCAGREAFARKGADVPRTGQTNEWIDHHLYVCLEDNEHLQRHLLFRDYLRQHSKARQEYGDLKKELARRYTHQRSSYGEAKTEFVKKILELAKEEII